MSDEFIQKLNEKHLCSWYILPLLELNIEAFGYSNFVNAYQVRGTLLIAVEVLDMHLCQQILLSPHFKQAMLINDNEYLLFKIPEQWQIDYFTFLGGQYSKMSDEAKQKIREMSGKKYEVPDEQGNLITDAILMALDNHKVLREKWKEVIGTTEFWLPGESLSKLRESSFITIENL